METTRFSEALEVIKACMLTTNCPIDKALETYLPSMLLSKDSDLKMVLDEEPELWTDELETYIKSVLAEYDRKLEVIKISPA